MNALKSAVKKVLPLEHRRRLRRWFNSVTDNRITNFGLARYCPCCKASLRRFRPFGLTPRDEAQCPICGALERHRLIWLYITRKTNLLDATPKRMLHVAPEPSLARLFRATASIDYVSGDLMNPKAMVQMDVTDIPFPDGSFDVVYCSHVLEHVPDDRKAMREFHRVLKAGGWAILQVPITVAATVEDPSITDPKERERLFGQHDHVRRYGPDYRERLAEAGFAVTVDAFAREFDANETKRFGLRQNEDIHFCTKGTKC